MSYKYILYKLLKKVFLGMQASEAKTLSYDVISAIHFHCHLG